MFRLQYCIMLLLSILYYVNYYPTILLPCYFYEPVTRRLTCMPPVKSELAALGKTVTFVQLLNDRIPLSRGLEPSLRYSLLLISSFILSTQALRTSNMCNTTWAKPSPNGKSLTYSATFNMACLCCAGSLGFSMSTL